MSGGPYGPKGEPPLVIIMVFILVFICQPFGRVPVSFISGGPYGPGGVLSDFEGEGVPKVFNRTDPIQRIILIETEGCDHKLQVGRQTSLLREI